MRPRKKTEITRVTPTNITRFTRSLDGIVENDLTLKTHKTKRESVDRIRSYAARKWTVISDAKSIS